MPQPTLISDEDQESPKNLIQRCQSYFTESYLWPFLLHTVVSPREKQREPFDSYLTHVFSDGYPLKIAHYVQDIKEAIKRYPALKDLFADRFTLPHPNFPFLIPDPHYPTPLPVEEFFDQLLRFATVLEHGPSLRRHVSDVERKKSDNPRDVLESDSLVFGLIAERRQWKDDLDSLKEALRNIEKWLQNCILLEQYLTDLMLAHYFLNERTSDLERRYYKLEEKGKEKKTIITELQELDRHNLSQRLTAYSVKYLTFRSVILMLGRSHTLLRGTCIPYASNTFDEVNVFPLLVAPDSPFSHVIMPHLTPENTHVLFDKSHENWLGIEHGFHYFLLANPEFTRKFKGDSFQQIVTLLRQIVPIKWADRPEAAESDLDYIVRHNSDFRERMTSDDWVQWARGKYEWDVCQLLQHSPLEAKERDLIFSQLQLDDKVLLQIIASEYDGEPVDEYAEALKSSPLGKAKLSASCLEKKEPEAIAVLPIPELPLSIPRGEERVPQTERQEVPPAASASHEMPLLNRADTGNMGRNIALGLVGILGALGFSGGGIYLLATQYYIPGAILLAFGLGIGLISGYCGWSRCSKRPLINPAVSSGQAPLPAGELKSPVINYSSLDHRNDLLHLYPQRQQVTARLGGIN